MASSKEKKRFFNNKNSKESKSKSNGIKNKSEESKKSQSQKNVQGKKKQKPPQLQKKNSWTNLNGIMLGGHRIFNRQMFYDLIFSPSYLWFAACIFIVAETVINVMIIENVKYTEIDWGAYMQEVEGFLNGTWDYSQLKGDTGPLVYPAGFVYIFSALYYLTDHGTNIRVAQYIFAGIYLVTLALVFRIYNKSRKVPPYLLLFVCCTSYRIHSLYVLRLFNDPVAMLLLYAAINLLLSNYWKLGSVFFSLAVSVKMNVLLFAPALLLAYIYTGGILGTLKNLVICGLVQVALAAPFLIENPMAYITGSFDLSRVFLYEWTVNWRFLSEEMFVDKRLHIALLALHVCCLLLFAFTHWRKYLSNYAILRRNNIGVACQLLLLPLFISNFVGVVFSRSLHYQFYVWYFHSLPYLLWSTELSVVLRLLILGMIELCWNQYPSTVWSSALLGMCHLIVLTALAMNGPADKKLNATRKNLSKKKKSK